MQNKYYMNEKSEKYFRANTEPNYKKEGKLKVLELDNAVILPQKLVDGKIIGGVLNEKKEYIKECDTYFLRCGYDFDEKTLITSEKTAVYLGIYMDHWGHCLVETIQHLWYLLENDFSDNDNVEYVMLRYGYSKQTDELLKIFGLKNIKYITKSVRYKKVIVPEQSTQPGLYYTDEYYKTVRHIAGKIKPIKKDKVYFTRRQLPLNNLFGEEAIEKIFKQNGFEIIAPEKLSAREQIGIIRGVKTLAAVSGSAAHNLLFAEKGVNFISIERTEIINREQSKINQMVGVHCTRIDAVVSFLPAVPWAGPFMLGVTPYFKDFLKDNNMKFNEKKLFLNDDNLLAYLGKYQEYYSNSYYIDALKNSFSHSSCNDLLNPIFEKLKKIQFKDHKEKKSLRMRISELISKIKNITARRAVDTK